MADSSRTCSKKARNIVGASVDDPPGHEAAPRATPRTVTVLDQHDHGVRSWSVRSTGARRPRGSSRARLAWVAGGACPLTR